ncbi:hypothetical protein [Agathobaculum sp. Marseille-P7918]|uniref:hypothetical protein n=1 Tax=Agathobaculum sp. Marseille-P7918 TaxID=2479843 RepID=UPI003563422B
MYPHSLRHSFATISLENGPVQAHLGHYDPAFTLRTYVHTSKAMQKASAERMEKVATNTNFLPQISILFFKFLRSCLFFCK